MRHATPAQFSPHLIASARLANRVTYDALWRAAALDYLAAVLNAAPDTTVRELADVFVRIDIGYPTAS